MEHQDIPKLYRGVMSPIAEGGQHEYIREDRRPRDSGKDAAFNICFNLMIEHQFGVPLVRQRSLFVSGNASIVVRYAAKRSTEFIGQVTPTGAYQFLYSPWISDSFKNKYAASDLATRYKDCFRGHQLKRCQPLLQDISTTLTILESFFEENPDIDKGIFTLGGLSLKQRIYKVLKADLGYTMSDIAEGARTDSEIMLFNCPQGYDIQRISSEELPPEPISTVNRFSDWF